MGKKTVHRTWSPERAWQVTRAGSDAADLVIGALAVRKDGTVLISDRRGLVFAAQAGAGVTARRAIGLEDPAAADENAAAKDSDPGPVETGRKK